MKGKKPENCERLFRIVLSVLMLVAVWFIVRGGRRMAASVSSGEVEPAKDRPCVIVDAGHGGADPGKVSVDGSLEKDINLQIALKLQKFLQMQDVDVVLTRDSDAGLYDENASNKKVQDMKNRVGIIEERQPVVTVSIHQNSYHRHSIMRAARRVRNWRSGFRWLWRRNLTGIMRDRRKPMTAIICSRRLPHLL